MRTVFEPSSSGGASKERRVSRDFVLSALFIAAGILGLFAAEFPLSDSAPIGLVVAVGSCSIFFGLVLLIPRRPVPDPVLYGYSIGGFLALSLLIANGTTQLGTAIAAMPYLWFCVFFGAYLEPRAARLLIVMLCASFGGALIISEVPTTTSLWVIFSGTMIVTTEALLASNHALRVMARQDPLTGLLNRRGLDEAVVPVLAISERIGRPTSVAVIDLDEFKEINDSKGHAAGDRMLKEIALAWSNEKRDADLLSRSGGDEFVVVMPATDIDQARMLINRWRKAHPLPWSFGVAEVESGEDLVAVVERADLDLYLAKADVRSRTPGSVKEST